MADDPQDQPPVHAIPFWPLPILSFAVLGIFGAALASLLFLRVPQGAEQLVNFMLGQLSGALMTIVSYWFGSSAGSSRKTEYLAHAAVKKADDQQTPCKTSRNQLPI